MPAENPGVPQLDEQSADLYVHMEGDGPLLVRDEEPVALTHVESDNEYAYAPLCRRHDPTYSAIDLTGSTTTEEDLDTWRTDPGSFMRIVADFAGAQHVSPTAVADIIGILDAGLAHLSRSGIGPGQLHFVTGADLDTFVRSGMSLIEDGIAPADAPTDRRSQPASIADLDVMSLRRNAFQLARLVQANLDETLPLPGPLAVPAIREAQARTAARKSSSSSIRKAQYEARTHTRAATHDEVLLTRLASEVLHSNRAKFLVAAAVALATHTASHAEISQVRYEDLSKDCVSLPGVPCPSSPVKSIQPRTVSLDLWAQHVLAQRRAYAEKDRRFSEQDSVIYTGFDSLTSASAKTGAQNQLNKALDLAGLRGTPGLSMHSFNYWAAAKDALDPNTARQGAQRAGLSLNTLHRRLRQLGDRGEH